MNSVVLTLTKVVLCCVVFFPAGCLGQCTGQSYLDPIPAPKATDVLFPLPQQVASPGTTSLSLLPSFTFVSTGAKSTLLDRAIDRYKKLVLGDVDSNNNNNNDNNNNDNTHQPHTNKVDASVLEGLDVSVVSGNETLQYGVDESYKLVVNTPRAQLSANGVFGALRGLETFSQLVTRTYNSTTIQNAPWNIADSPRYLHRGLLIDTSRHFLPVATILKAIDGLAYTKMNVLHWHMVDAQSFPVESTSFPLLTNAKFTNGEVYTKTDIQNIVLYAHNRGVRVIPEIDTPGHTASWGVGYPDITVCRDKTRQQGYCAENPCGMLDPSKNRTYQILTGFLNEMIDIFPDQFFHFGADEVVLKCWNTPSIVSWMSANKLATVEAAFSYFEQQIFNLAKSRNRTPVHWQEVFEEKVQMPSNAIVQVWKDFDTLHTVVTAGYRAILSNYQAWYLDCGFANWCPYCSWIDIYNNDPLQGKPLTPQQQSLILGGEVAIWGELVDEWNFESRVWPRTAAAGERLWSPASVKSIPDAMARLVRHSCRLGTRGIHGDAIIPGSNTRDCVFVQQ